MERTGLGNASRDAMVLYIISKHGPVDALDIANYLLVSGNSARYILKRLERRNLVTRQPNSSAGSGYVLTSTGSEYLNLEETSRSGQ